MADNSKRLWKQYNGKGFSAEHSDYAVRASNDENGNKIDTTYATRKSATSSEAGLMSAADKSKLDGITDYVVSAAVSGSTLTLTPKTGSAVAFTASGEANVIESVKLGSDTLTPASKVVTIPLFNSTTNGAVTAPTAANRNHYSFLDGMGDWSMMDEVSEADISDIFVDGVHVGDRKYPYVQIGNKLWTTKNLDWKFDGIRLNPDDNGWNGYSAWYYNRDEQTYGLDGTYKCGLLYTYMSAVYIDSLLTDGWRVPTDSDFQTLIDNYQATDLLAKANSITTGFPNTTWSGTNSTGLSLLPTGRVFDGNMTSFNPNTLADYSIQSWTTSYVSHTDPLQAKYFQYNSYYYQLSNNSSRNNGYPIRLVKDIT